MKKKIRLQLLEGAYAVSRLSPSSAIPAWADGPGFVSISRGREELSIVCRQERVPEGITTQGGWTALCFAGPFAFDEIGIVLSVVQPLSERGIGVFVVSTYDTDYMLLKSADMARATEVLIDAGHTLLPA
ncbi:ACT domain-containing protein [Castellaniella sp.]|uniref:ACT domain-containing protein n=1 Tax=Castellaniella sp. TaxID=1955812 RepID=UPI002AFF76A3|nr:ACT domain-containing protein [Castellaniella sp.]